MYDHSSHLLKKTKFASNPPQQYRSNKCPIHKVCKSVIILCTFTTLLIKQEKPEFEFIDSLEYPPDDCEEFESISLNLSSAVVS